MYEACILDRCLITVPSSYGSLPPIASSLLTSAPYSYWSLPLIGLLLILVPSSYRPLPLIGPFLWRVSFPYLSLFSPHIGLFHIFIHFGLLHIFLITGATRWISFYCRSG